MLFVVFQIAVFAQTDVTTNLIPNPGFELGGTDGWYFASDFGHLHANDGGTYNGVITITGDPEDVAVGDSAGKITVTEGINMWEIGPRTTAVTAVDLAGKTLTISFRLKKTWPDETTQQDNPGIGKVMMKIYADGTAIETHTPIEGLPGSFGFGNGEVLVDNGADYKVAGFQAVVPPGTTELQIGFWMGKYGTYYLDDFQIYEGGLTPALTKPEMPQEFQVDPAVGTSTELLWLNNSEAVTSFVILKNEIPIDTLDAVAETYAVDSLDANTKYVFGIFALNGQISSDTATTVFNPDGQEEAKYTVVFDDLRNTSTAEANVSNEYKVALPDAPSRYGYDFGGWFTGRDGSGTEFTAETVVDADMTVYAYWMPSNLPSIDVTDGFITNPGFEDDTTGWELYVPGGAVASLTATEDTAHIAAGTKAGKVEVTTGVNFWEMPLRSDTSNVDLSGKTLAISFKSKRLWQTGEKKTIIKVKFPGGALWLTPIENYGFANGECYYDENNQNEYKLFGFTFTVPDTVTTGLFIELWVGAEGTYYFDDFQVYEGISPVFVEELPCALVISDQPSAVTVSVDGTATLTVAASGGVSGLTYQWEESDDNGSADAWANAVGGSSSTTESYTAPTSSAGAMYYRVVVSDAGEGCEDAISSSALVTVTGPNSISAPSANDIHIYPNPVQDRLYVKGITNEMHWTITSLTGVAISTGRTIDINVSDLQSGFYLIKLENDEGVLGIRRFIKE